jgi:cytochrome c biogenesis protein CcmG/thiol:disulfide interchange protein DsbE
MTRWLAVLPLIVLVALGALFGLFALHHDPQVQPQALVGKPMPDLTLPSLDDPTASVRLNDALAQGPVLVNFFASWCGPCAIEQPTLMALKAKGVRIIGVNYEDVAPRGSPDAAQAFLAKLGDPYVQRLTDGAGRAGIEFGVTGVPESYLVGRDGKIIAKHSGPIDPNEVDALAARLR